MRFSLPLIFLSLLAAGCATTPSASRLHPHLGAYSGYRREATVGHWSLWRLASSVYRNPEEAPLLLTQGDRVVLLLLDTELQLMGEDDVVAWFHHGQGSSRDWNQVFVPVVAPFRLVVWEEDLRNRSKRELFRFDPNGQDRDRTPDPAVPTAGEQSRSPPGGTGSPDSGLSIWPEWEGAGG